MNENSEFHHKLNVLSQFIGMSSRYILFIFLFFFFHGHAQNEISRIDSMLKSVYPASGPGAVIAVVKNRQLIFKKSYGLADLRTGRPISANENFNIGSLTKQFTAFAVLHLYEKRKISLDDPIGKYFSLPPALANITIRQLLNHSSGIPDHYGFTDTSLVRHATDHDVLASIRHADTLYFRSGTHYRYSNTAYCLLGLLIEKLTGKTYETYLREVIFSPLGMDGALVFNIKRAIPKRVIGYDLSAEGRYVKSDADESIFFSTESDGGIYLSMNDYMRWCNALEWGRFSGAPEIQMAWRGQTPVDSLHNLYYGNGWFVHQSAGEPKIIYHTGFNGGFRTVVFMIPKLNYYVSIFSNRGDIDLEDLVSRINRILHVQDNSFIKSGPLESFIHSWHKFAPCKETSSFLTSFTRNLNARDMELN